MPPLGESNSDSAYRINRRTVCPTALGPRAGRICHFGGAAADELVQVPVRINGVLIDAPIDTSATISIANPAARAALGLAAYDPRFRPTAPFASPPAVRRAPPLRPRPDRPGTRAGYCAGPISFWAK
jgi:hypothetical protein